MSGCDAPVKLFAHFHGREPMMEIRRRRILLLGQKLIECLLLLRRTG